METSGHSEPRNWVLTRAEEILAQHEQLTIDGFVSETAADAQAQYVSTRDGFGTRRAKAEIIATLVTIAVQPIPDGASVDWLVRQTSWINGLRVRPGPAIVAAIIAGYEALPSRRGRRCCFHR